MLFRSAVSKNNLSKIDGSLKFRVVQDEKFGCSRIEWIGKSSVTANQLYVEQNPEDKNLTEEAIEFLISILQSGEMTSKDVQNHARDENISEKALRRAREKVCNVARKNSGVNHASYWSLKPQYRTLAPLIDVISGGLASSEPPTPLFD